MVARPWSSSRLSCGECLFLSCDGNAGNSFPTTMGKDPSSRARRRQGAPLDVGGTLVLPLEWRRLCRVTFRVATRVGTTIWKFQRLGVISLETPQRKWASSPWRGEPPGFSRVGAGTLDLRQGSQGPALVASGKASPHASCSRASRDSSPLDAGA